MAAQNDELDQEAFDRKVGWATIKNFWFAIAAFVVLAILGLLQLPWIQRWIDAEHPSLRAFVNGAKAWLTNTWTLPWLVWFLIIFAAYGLGVLSVWLVASDQARERFLQWIEPLVLVFHPYWRRDREMAPPEPTAPEEDKDDTYEALFVPPRVPEPDQMDNDQRAVLSLMGLRINNVRSSEIAGAVMEPEVTVIATLQQLQNWGLVTSGAIFWKLTADGIAYVTKHRAVFLDR